ncbi:MAG: hypothetical protein HZA49_04960 [Planctomycetes bacterium]|nr:hypothetical protein [Planctomycetota bacterium]
MREMVSALTSREKELQSKLSDSEKTKIQLQAQISNLKKQLSGIEEQISVSQTTGSAIKDTESDKHTSFNKENMRLYARAIMALEGDGEPLRKDPTLQTAFQELMADIMKMMAKYNIDFDMWGTGDEVLYKAYAIPEIRQWFSELGAATFEEAGVPLTKAQLKAVDEAMLRRAEEGKKLNDPSVTNMEKAVMFQRFMAKQDKEFRDIFTDEQERKLPGDVATTLIGLNRVNTLPNVDASVKTKDECSNIFIQKWGNELKLNDSEKQYVKYVSDMYVNEYVVLKASAEAEYGKEFMDYNLERYDRADKYKYMDWYVSRWRYFDNPENKRRQDAVNLRFAELQLKYQKQLQSIFPDKLELIKEQRPQITHFPYLTE